ncbi:MAG: hypothetical protein ACI4I4_07400 [Acutalibacteraceae bacterium]
MNFNITRSEYQNVLNQRIESQNNAYKELLLELILKGKINIKEIPFLLRTSDRSFYIAALRISRNSCKKLIDDLKLMKLDIQMIENEKIRKDFTDIFESNFLYLQEKYKDDDQYGNFIENTRKKILPELLF